MSPFTTALFPECCLPMFRKPGWSILSSLFVAVPGQVGYKQGRGAGSRGPLAKGCSNGKGDFDVSLLGEAF